MAIYIKANRLVAEHLKLEKIRFKLADGNYLLWQADMQAFGPLYQIHKSCELIGALPLQPWEAKQEQQGTVIRPLPVATDPRFVLPEPEQVDEVADTVDEIEDVIDEVIDEAAEDVAEDLAGDSDDDTGHDEESEVTNG